MENTTPQHGPFYPKLHCTRATQFIEWRPDQPGCPPTAGAIGPFGMLCECTSHSHSAHNFPKNCFGVNKLRPQTEQEFKREPIFKDDPDWIVFLETLGQAFQKTDWLVSAWCWLGHGFHLVAGTPKAKSGGRNAVVLGGRRGAFQPATKVVSAATQR